MYQTLFYNSYHAELCDYIEKFNEKTFSWNKKWLVLNDTRIIIYDKKPVNDMEMCRPAEIHFTEGSSVKCFKDYKYKNLPIKKSNVCVINLRGSGNLTISFKSEIAMQKLSEFSTKNNNTIHYNSPVKIENLEKSENLEKFTFNKNENSSLYTNYRQDLKKKDKSTPSSINLNKTNSIHHQKNKSCGDYQTMINRAATTSTEGKNTNLSYFYTTESVAVSAIDNKIKNSAIFPNMNCSSINNKLSSSRLHEARKNSAINKSADNITIKQNIDNSNKKQSDLIKRNEENSSLSTIINNMLASSKKSSNELNELHGRNSKNKITDSFTYTNGCEIDRDNLNLSPNDKLILSSSKPRINCTNNINTSSSSSSALMSRNKQIDKIIKLSLQSVDGHNINLTSMSSPNESMKSTFKIFNNDKVDSEKHQKSSFNFNLSQDEMSFEEKDKTSGITKNTILDDSEDKIQLLNRIVKKLENFEEYFYDTGIFKRMYRSVGLKKIDIGQIYNNIQPSKTYIKYQLLTEMIAILSKKFLKESILKSLEIVLREKDMNKNYFISPNDKHSLEFCIVDIFNTFLGNNTQSEEFYLKVLPGYLNESFSIPILLNIRDHICITNLFVTMQNHNKIIFYDNIDINFTDRFPFVVQDIKYISPYYVNKWYGLSIENSIGDNIDGKSKIKNNAKTPQVIGTTNIKRMKYNNFEMKDSFNKMLKQLRRAEKDSEEFRLSLIKNIYFHIFSKRNELALKLCDFYVQKYADSISLNPIVYLVLSEIYNETVGIDLARMFYEKAVNILNWQSNGDNPLIIDLNYTFSLLLMKQIVNVEERENNINSKPCNENPNYEIYTSIEELLEKSLELCEKFFDFPNEKNVKIYLQLSLIKLSRIDVEHNCQYSHNHSDTSTIHDIIDKVIHSLDFLISNQFYKEEVVYLNLFVDIMNGMPIIENETKIKFIQRLHDSKKKIKN